MKKDFNKWNTKKISINDATGKALFHEREVWWCSLGANVGYEQDGSSELFTRPVIIFKKFNLDSCLVIPLTSKTKSGKYYFPVGIVDEKEAIAVLSQIRFVDRRRLAMKITMVNQDTFKRLREAFSSCCLPNASP